MWLVFDQGGDLLIEIPSGKREDADAFIDKIAESSLLADDLKVLQVVPADDWLAEMKEEANA